MREPAFWWRPPGVAAALLSPLGAAYGALSGARMAKAGRRAGIPVICVGNLTLGGAGKTPTAMAVVDLLQSAGGKPFVLSRGYGGNLKGPIRVDPAHHRAADVGDEPLLLVRHAPTIVSRDRVAGAEAARTRDASVIVMDDGFQNPGLHKDRSIVVVDGGQGVGNGCVFPAGPLRAPLERQLQHANAVLVIGTGSEGDAIAQRAQGRGLPVFRGRLVPDAGTLEQLRGEALLAFAGIGHPEKFFATLREAGLAVRARVPFPDHHRYRRTEAIDLIARAEREGLVPVTTEKDMARLAGQDDVASLAKATRSLPVRLVVDEPAAFRDFVLAAVG